MKLRPSVGLEEAHELGARVLSQALEIWVTPEIERRRAGGQVKRSVAVNAFQIIMPSPREKKKDVVRINDEVRAILRCKPNTDLAKGELVRVGQIDEISGVKLTDDEDPNSGHMTGLNLAGQWIISFDLRRDKGYSRQLLRSAREFFGSANLCLERNLLGPAVDDLHAAAELAAKADLLMVGFYPYENPKDHGALTSRYAKWTKLGNAPAAANSALSRLKRERAAARYGEGQLKTKDIYGLMKSVDALITHVESSLHATAFEESREVQIDG